MWRFELVVGDHDDRNVVSLLDFNKVLALFVEQKVGDCGRRLHQHLTGFFFHCLFFDQAQHRQ